MPGIFFTGSNCKWTQRTLSFRLVLRMGKSSGLKETRIGSPQLRAIGNVSVANCDSGREDLSTTLDADSHTTFHSPLLRRDPCQETMIETELRLHQTALNREFLSCARCSWRPFSWVILSVAPAQALGNRIQGMNLTFEASS